MDRIIFALIGVVSFLFFIPIDSIAFRCGDGFVSVGDTKTKVLLECGKPTSKEKVAAKKATDSNRVRTNRSNKQKEEHKNKETAKNVEKWYYNCGENDFIYILTFEGGILKKEETGGYGKGKQVCGKR